ncbi:acyl-CoA carboxylase subunit epsilon [Microbacterium indicum]|uniref:acyl-CoA carboxylase subunit epsilon n=1 Tax=Microbacterium indicum TaxID=358100 RepID=UPI0003F664CC|nr:acyl-CoA carboxylase subunit epsilon [Microbacterium indicum]
MSDAPVVQIVGGDPTADELAAIVAVVSEAYVQEAAAATVPEAQSSTWTTSRRLRRYSRTPWGRFAG